MKCSGENVILRGIFHVVSRGNLDYLSNSVGEHGCKCGQPVAPLWARPSEHCTFGPKGIGCTCAKTKTIPASQ